MKLGLIGALAGLILGWWLGIQLVKGQWAEADNAALREQETLTADALGDWQDAEEKSAVAEAARLQTELRIEQVENELRTAINQAPLVETIEIEVLGDCPAISCPMPDTRQHFRLWNSAINNSAEALFPAIETDIGHAVVWRSHHFAYMDADCGFIDENRNGTMGPLELDQCGGKWLDTRVLVRASH